MEEERTTVAKADLRHQALADSKESAAAKASGKIEDR